MPPPSEKLSCLKKSKEQVNLLKDGIKQELYSLPESDEKNAQRAIVSLKVMDIFIGAAHRAANDDRALAA